MSLNWLEVGHNQISDVFIKMSTVERRLKQNEYICVWAEQGGMGAMLPQAKVV